jgi:hypothetical protein
MVNHFYNGTIRKYIVLFGRMFNDIDIVRKNKNSTKIQTLRVPIAYGPKEKWLTRLNQDAGLNRPVSIQLPRLSFEVTAMNYDSTRTLNKMHKYSSINDETNRLTSQYTPVPYNINVSLYGMFANNEDAVQVTEQILPFFRPEWTSSLKLIDELGEYWDIPTVYNDMSIEDSYDSDFVTRRAIVYTWNFSIKGYLFGPVRSQGVIKRTVIDMTVNSTSDPIGTEVGPDKKIILTPGQLANGSSTTSSSESIIHTSIVADSDWDYAFDSNDYFDGANRHDH